MSDQETRLRPIGTEFEQTVETARGGRVTERVRVIDHVPDEQGNIVELLHVLSRQLPSHQRREPSVLK